MTYAPTDLMTVRSVILSASGLSGDAVGIVGDPAHKATGGYHCGNDWLAQAGRLNSDYSKRESARDRPGTNGASALDVGDGWKRGIGLRAFSQALVKACMDRHPGTADVREIIYTPDGKTVRRFDRLGIRSSGDSSHLWHTHVSFFRDSEGRRAGPFLDLVKTILSGGSATTGGGGDDPVQIAAVNGHYYVGDGVFRRNIIDWPEHENLIAAGAKEKVFTDEFAAFGYVGRVDAEALLSSLNAVLNKPGSSLTITADAVKQLTEALGPMIEDKIRKVLGGLDE